jgi:hypothetical protein
MKNLKTILIILVFTLFFRCSNYSDQFFDPTYWSSPYKGITFTDEFANPLKKDKSDWCESHVGYAFLPAYPNPVDRDNEGITLVFFVSQESRIKVLVNDGDYQTVAIITDTVYSRGLYELKWNLRDQTGSKIPGGVYRSYMYAPDFSCHGDIWIR